MNDADGASTVALLVGLNVAASLNRDAGRLHLLRQAIPKVAVLENVQRANVTRTCQHVHFLFSRIAATTEYLRR